MNESYAGLESFLHKRRILVVEDEATIVVMTQMALATVGCHVYLAQDMRRAHKLASTKNIDCALLDIAIGDDDVFPVADILVARSVPFVFSSGYDKEALPEHHRSCVILPKPYLFADAVRALVAAMHPAALTLESGDRPQALIGGPL